MKQSTRHWRHNERNGVSNHWRLDCLLSCLFTRKSKKTSNLRVTGLCEGYLSVSGGFPSQRASNAEMVLFGDVIMDSVLSCFCQEVPADSLTKDQWRGNHLYEMTSLCATASLRVISVAHTGVQAGHCQCSNSHGWTWWRHQMETFFLCYWFFVWRNHRCTWRNGWTNNRDACDLRRHCGHYDMTVMR